MKKRSMVLVGCAPILLFLFSPPTQLVGGVRPSIGTSVVFQCGTCQPTGSPPYGQNQCYSWSYTSCSWVPTSCQQSPIIIDTDGRGFELTSVADGVSFDISGTGSPIRMAWTTPGSKNAFLALDRDHDGKVDSGKELFGNYTPQPPSVEPNGFLALAVFDMPANGGNDDGVIDQNDSIYSHLVLWIDENHDGISQPSELHSLSELGLFSISVSYRESKKTDQFGNQFRYRSAVNPDVKTNQPRDGRWAYDVFFATQARNSGSSARYSIQRELLAELKPRISNTQMCIPPKRFP
jgi:hypothetical protein